MHNAWCIYLHFGSLGGFHVSKLYHTRPCILYLLLHFWLFLMVKYMVNATSMQVDMLWPLSVWAGFFITMTNYAKPPFCFFFWGVNPTKCRDLPYIPRRHHPPFKDAPPWSSKPIIAASPRLRVRYWSSNRCTMGDACNFAHSDTELREQPDLVPRFVGWGSFAPLDAPGS